ncbi:MAG: M28 family peptidase [Muricauda sp.]|jgi:N-acetylated-alpha-linked acidic dipeptidase|nr:M28 family peptidase [Allomuricauda sp.]MBO6590299.1 M28 family peptidase [Allomuricauda sp.]MBO6619925.1 M28 family peptidase [Allomuricauda sp.]MBO6645733.1 M28 family peptidase [Allomuricauda sp.]MBO6748263.1 M28 family peptidase [Allomuricauda sp.]MBO6843567.1 M28 family peptidase [Allomuricauda sp.]
MIKLKNSRKNSRYLIAFAGLMLTSTLSAQDWNGYTPSSMEQQAQTEATFLKTVDFPKYREHLQKLTEKPHVAGTAANEEVANYMATVMENAGMKVDFYPYDIYMSTSGGSSSVELVTPYRRPLNQQENILDEDRFSSDPTLEKGWNAYSGNGDVTAAVVYANYGTKEDFERLAEMGIDVKGKIVIARYGRNFRGYKAKFAEQYGAAGLIMYTDPADSGYAKGLVYPEGYTYNESAIQRGSVLTLDYQGDPLTPFEPALPLDGKMKVQRMDPSEAALHTIPVLPLPYGSAKEIIGNMKGKPVPQEWQGGLPYTYRLEGGEELTVRLYVDQPKEFVRVSNVVGTFKGTEYPDEWIILGCHYDAWAFGATDPNSGTAMLLSLSESIGKLVKSGNGPKRSILIAHWDAEEHGVIGSSEWVEQLKDELGAKAVAYLNFDGGVSGKNFGASSSPTLKNLVSEMAKKVDYPYSEKSLYDQWRGDKEEPTIGNLGGGSDHIGFYMHVGVPSLSGGAGGPTLYHTNYDSFHFYETFVDPEFKMGGTIEQWTGLMTLRMANAELIPYDVERYTVDLKGHFAKAVEKIKGFHAEFEGFDQVDQSIATLEKNTQLLDETLANALSSGALSKKEIKDINRQLIALEKSFIDEKGMYYGSWFKSLYASTDPFSGYASWILPGLEYEISLKSTDRLEEWDLRYASAISSLASKVLTLAQSIR